MDRKSLRLKIFRERRSKRYNTWRHTILSVDLLYKLHVEYDFDMKRSLKSELYYRFASKEQ